MIDGVCLLRPSFSRVIGINGVLRIGCEISSVDEVSLVELFCCGRGFVIDGV